MIHKFIGKFRNIEEKACKKFGEFVLFGLFFPDNAAQKWDLVISASWLKRDDFDTLKSFSKILNRELGDDMRKLSKFVVLAPTEPFVRAVNEEINVTKDIFECANCEFNDLEFKRAFIITSQKSAKTNAAAKSHFRAAGVPA